MIASDAEVNLARRSAWHAALATLLVGLPVLSAGAADADARRFGDYQKIVAVLKQYIVAIDSTDADLYAAAFAEEGATFSIRDVTRRGRNEIRLEINTSAGLSAPVTWHLMSSSRVEFTGSRTARHHAYYQVWTRVNEHPGGVVRLTSPVTLVAIGRYDDELVKVGSRWFIQSRKVTPDTSGGF